MARDVKEKLFEIDSKKIELDFLQQQFLVECKRFAAQSIEGKVRFAISSNAKKAITLGKLGLTPIKNQVNDMIDNISDMVDKIVNQGQLWLHTRETLVAKDFPTDQYLVKGSRGPEILETALKKILSPLGKLLITHGLDTDKNWEENHETLLYCHPLDWSKEMSHCIRQYNERFNELSKLVEEYESLSMQSSGNDALDLWDSL
ncbi:MAG: hypothetical protein KKE61_19080 [Proteobacteria bacterium]|nr:hypothetical protein [Pseudomonadota bacterium]